MDFSRYQADVVLTSQHKAVLSRIELGELTGSASGSQRLMSRLPALSRSTAGLTWRRAWAALARHIPKPQQRSVALYRIEYKKRSALCRLPPRMVGFPPSPEHRMHPEQRKTSNEINPVSSFVTAVMPGAGESVCIKYALYNGGSRLSYWEAKWFTALYQCVEYYSGMHYYGSDMQRAADEPAFSAGLPVRHPIRTMISERPTLTEKDYWTAKQRFCVASLGVVDQGDSCRVECTFANGSRRTDVMPGYIVMNLCGYLKASRDVSALVTSKPGGSA